VRTQLLWSNKNMFGDDGCENNKQERTLNDEDDNKNTQHPADCTNVAYILKQTQQESPANAKGTRDSSACMI